jgi:hypothetical protein
MSPTLRAVVLIAIILAFLTVVIMQFNQFSLAGDISIECREKKVWVQPSNSFSNCKVDLWFFNCLADTAVKNHNAVELFDKKCLDTNTGATKGNN